jgi:hypothetical protein
MHRRSTDGADLSTAGQGQIALWAVADPTRGQDAPTRTRPLLQAAYSFEQRHIGKILRTACGSVVVNQIVDRNDRNASPP